VRPPAPIAARWTAAREQERAQQRYRERCTFLGEQLSIVRAELDAATQGTNVSSENVAKLQKVMDEYQDLL